MKAGLTTSVVLHASLLAFGLLTVSAPKPFEVVESLAVSTITETELAQLVKGDKKAPVKEAPAPKPTKRPETVKNAVNEGDNDIDLETAPTPTPAPRKVETAQAPKSEPDPAPVPTPKPEPKPQPKAEPKPVPATEAKVEPAPKQDVKPDPVKEAIKEAPKPDPVKEAIEEAPKESETAVKLPDSTPVPQARPTPPAPPTPPAQTAKAPERKDSDKPSPDSKPTKDAKPSTDSKPSKAEKSDTASLDDDIKALINKEKATGTGAKRQTKEAAAGNSRTNAEKLTRAEMDVLREQIGGCWSIDAGISDPDKLKVSVKFNVDASGKLDGTPTVTKSSGNASFDRSAVRAIQKCDMRGLALPEGKHETWSEVIVNFDPTDMFF